MFISINLSVRESLIHFWTNPLGKSMNALIPLQL